MYTCKCELDNHPRKQLTKESLIFFVLLRFLKVLCRKTVNFEYIFVGVDNDNKQQTTNNNDNNEPVTTLKEPKKKLRQCCNNLFVVFKIQFLSFVFSSSLGLLFCLSLVA